MQDQISIANIIHPLYEQNVENWFLWRSTYEAGTLFIRNYLEKFSAREDDPDFELRKKITYCPAFAKSAVNDVKNSIYQRMADISRQGGTDSYQQAVSGDLFGVDLLGSSMDTFVGQKVLPEMLVMRKVGVYVDMPTIQGKTVRDTANKRPYYYIYPAEDIRSWVMDETDDPNEFKSLILKETYNTFDPKFNMPNGIDTRYRHINKTPEGVFVTFYNVNGDLLEDPILLNLPTIPFVVFEITDSLLTDVANYQIALLNLASSDINYSLKSNFPFYVEQYDPRMESLQVQNNADQIDVGVSSGRKYPVNMNPPAFIHPSSEPLKISIEKQNQLKTEIKQLVNLNLSSLAPTKQASAESKSLDNQGLEAGLSYIGLELQRGERRLAAYWSLYEGKKDQIATINYPEKYSLKTDEERRAEAKDLETIKTKIPSSTFQKEVSKRIAKELLGNKISAVTMLTIEEEIDDAEVLSSDPAIIQKDVEIGLVDTRTASKARGYPDGVVDKAEEDHTNRLVRIAEAQTIGTVAKQDFNNPGKEPSVTEINNPASRGLSDLSGSPAQDAKQEKQQSKNTATDGTVTSKVRGPANG